MVFQIFQFYQRIQSIFISTSSVYGNSKKNILAETDNVDHPINFMQHKRSNELMAHAYSSLYNLPTTGLDFLQLWTMGKTRYGLIFIYKSMLNNRPIYVFNRKPYKRFHVY